MKRNYTDNLVVAEQFTDDCVPDGVMIAPEEFIQKVLVPSLRNEYKGMDIYLFKYPRPSQTDKEVADSFGVPYPFAWIHKGDYVITYPSGYARVESQISFERDYKEVAIVLHKRAGII